MRAMVFDRYGEPDVMSLSEEPVPEPKDGEVLIRVGFAGVNPSDSKARSGESARAVSGLYSVPSLLPPPRFRPIPVDLRRARPSTCPTMFPGVRPDALSLYSFTSEKSTLSKRFPPSRKHSNWPHSLLLPTTGVKSAAYSMDRWGFAESLAGAQALFAILLDQ